MQWFANDGMLMMDGQMPICQKDCRVIVGHWLFAHDSDGNIKKYVYDILRK